MKRGTFLIAVMGLLTRFGRGQGMVTTRLQRDLWTGAAELNLNYRPIGEVMVYRNGILQAPYGFDYTIVGGTIQFVAAVNLQPDDRIQALYWTTG